ncbi:hypothetical protein [Pimelobacter simplex]|uniref:hypothetical protein n=1 Tax=Nocardioides simplex TaxID=2045 RepID=UPI00214FD81C|nr:hypothetical protein [Pimelobacter simplex]UUW92198.1 hypothetical protein M0M43_12165 [Pimelobacter simplex]UUW96024.1 hypothetical protein M0M48_00790 [Pimelobacter simplex]
MDAWKPTRRQVVGGAAGLAAYAVASTVTAPRASAALLLPGNDFVASYEAAWQAVDTTVHDNEAGQLAWGTSYVLLSLVRMYQATGNALYLDRFVEQADAVWAKTDEARGVVDWQGRSGPVWRTGADYTTAAAVVAAADGTALFEIRSANAGATTATVTVAAVSGGSFNLTLTHPGLAPSSVTLSGVSLDPASANSIETKVADVYHYPVSGDLSKVFWTVKRLGGSTDAVPAAGTTALSRRYCALSGHTGLIGYPIALFARLVLEGNLTSAHGAPLKPVALDYLARIRRAVAFHDPEWRFVTLTNGHVGGDYVAPYGAPVPHDGLIQPLNLSHAMGQLLVELYRIDRTAALRPRINAMVRTFRVCATEVGTAWKWTYWPTHSELYSGYAAVSGRSEYTPAYGFARQVEDISHAAISVEFLTAAARAGAEAGTADTSRLVATYLNHVKAGTSTAYYRVNGTEAATASQAAQAGRWLSLAQWGSTIVGHVEAVYRASSLSPTSSSHLPGIAYVAWARNQGWLRD